MSLAFIYSSFIPCATPSTRSPFPRPLFTYCCLPIVVLAPFPPQAFRPLLLWDFLAPSPLPSTPHPSTLQIPNSSPDLSSTDLSSPITHHHRLSSLARPETTLPSSGLSKFIIFSTSIFERTSRIWSRKHGGPCILWWRSRLVLSGQVRSIRSSLEDQLFLHLPLLPPRVFLPPTRSNHFLSTTDFSTPTIMKRLTLLACSSRDAVVGNRSMFGDPTHDPLLIHTGSSI